MNIRFIINSILIFLLGCQPIFAQPIVVCKNCQTSTLKQAIVLAKDYDTILIKKGTYKEYNIEINKPLTIIGENYPVIDGELKGEIITIVSDHVVVDGLFIINVGTSYTEDFAAIRVKRSKYFEIKNLVLEKLFFGIYLEKAANGKVYHNKVIGDAVTEHNSGNAIQLWYSKNIIIENNIVQHVRDGIYLEFSDNCLIKNNVSTNNLRYGLHFMFSNNDTYYNNVFKNNGAGVAVMFSKFITMYQNKFLNNWGSASYGLLLKEIYDTQPHLRELIDTASQMEGTVRNVVDFGAFIDIGVKQDGLLHRSQVPRSAALSVGDILTVSIQSIDPDRGRISLGWATATD